MHCVQAKNRIGLDGFIPTEREQILSPHIDSKCKQTFKLSFCRVPHSLGWENMRLIFDLNLRSVLEMAYYRSYWEYFVWSGSLTVQ